MTAVEKKIRERLAAAMGGFTEAELGAAFSLVANKENWKMPIRAMVIKEKAEVVGYAVPWFTGGPATITPTHYGTVLVTAAGYYACVGA